MGSEIHRSQLPPVGEPQRQVRVEYQLWLDRIDDELVGGGLLVAESLPRVTRAFLVGDRTCIDEVRVMASDVTERCRYVEEQGFLLLAREAPVAGDLRRLVSILRLVFAVERSASLLRHVAESLDRFDPRQLPEDVRRQVEELGVRCAEVFRRGLDAWRQRDGLAVHEVDTLDASVDTLEEGLLTLAEERMQGSSELLLLGLLARYFERIADHGVSFAQHATFAVTGERVEVGP
jgi:phosphate transport system protein